MASEKSIRMQQAANLDEIKAMLLEIHYALGIKPKPEEKAKADEVAQRGQKPKVEVKPPVAPPATGSAAVLSHQGTVSRQNPRGR